MIEDNNQPQDGEQPVEGLLDNVSIENNEAVDTKQAEISHLAATEEDDDGPLERPDWWPENVCLHRHRR